MSSLWLLSALCALQRCIGLQAQELSADPPHLDVRPSRACPYDAVSLAWVSKTSAWGVALYDDADAPDAAYLARIPAALAAAEPTSLPADWDELQAAKRRREREAQPMVPTVGCAFGGEDCEAPKLLSLVASPGYDPGSTLDVGYDKDTDTPGCATKELVDTLARPLRMRTTHTTTNQSLSPNVVARKREIDESRREDDVARESSSSLWRAGWWCSGPPSVRTTRRRGSTRGRCASW